MISGYKISKVYKDDVDFTGKTTYKKYDPQTGEFLLVKPLVSGYEQAMITKPIVSLTLDPFYKKYTDAKGIPIVSSEKTPNTIC